MSVLANESTVGKGNRQKGKRATYVLFKFDDR